MHVAIFPIARPATDAAAGQPAPNQLDPVHWDARLKLNPTEATKKPVRFHSIQPSAECAAIRAEEPLVLFAQAACLIVVGAAHQERDGVSPALGRHERGRKEAAMKDIVIRTTHFVDAVTHCMFPLQGNYNRVRPGSQFPSDYRNMKAGACGWQATKVAVLPALPCFPCRKPSPGMKKSAEAIPRFPPSWPRRSAERYPAPVSLVVRLPPPRRGSPLPAMFRPSMGRRRARYAFPQIRREGAGHALPPRQAAG